MNGQQLRAALHGGANVYGTLISSPSPKWPETVQHVDIDFVFIDTEHTALDRETVSWMCRAYGEIGKAGIVRIGSPDPYDACQVLDDGAVGVIAPYVETADQVRALVGGAKLRPLKGRRLDEGLQDPNTLGDELRRYLDELNSGKVLIVNIESVPAIENLAEIVAVPGLDAVLIGPHDLSCSLGIPEQYDHPRFDEAVRQIINTARAVNVGAGIHVFYGNVEQEINWCRAGANLIVHGADVYLFSRLLRSDIATLREALGDETTQDVAKDSAI